MSAIQYLENVITYSEIESNRFGMNVFRGNVETLDLQQLLNEMDEYNADMIIVRIPCEKMVEIYSKGLSIIPHIVADTLVYYHNELRNYTPKPICNNDLHYVEIKPNDVNILNFLVNECFTNYKNHYSANPYLSSRDILEGYQEWANSFVMDNTGTKKAYFITKSNRIVGFANYSYFEKIKEVTWTLGGVLSCYQGLGVYSDTIRWLQGRYKEKNYNLFYISTQIQNYTVQKVWAKEGFVFNKAFNTIYFNKKDINRALVSQNSFKRGKWK